MAKLPHSSMTVFQLKQAIETYKAKLAQYAPIVPVTKQAKEAKKHLITRYSSLLRTAEFTLQRKQDAQAKEVKPQDVKKAKAALLQRFAVHLSLPFSRLDHEAIFRDAQTLIQNHNA